MTDKQLAILLQYIQYIRDRLSFEIDYLEANLPESLPHPTRREYIGPELESPIGAIDNDSFRAIVERNQSLQDNPDNWRDAIDPSEYYEILDGLVTFWHELNSQIRILEHTG